MAKTAATQDGRQDAKQEPAAAKAAGEKPGGKAAAEQKPAPGRKKSRKKLALVGGVAVLALAVAGGGVFVIQQRQAAQEADLPGAAKAARKTRSDGPPLFVRLETFTVKLQPDPDKPEQYLQTVPELRVLDTSVSDRVKMYMPEIRYRTLLLLSSKKPSDIATPQGVERLSSELRAQINHILDGDGGPRPNVPAKPHADPEDPTQAVLFTSFIIQ